MKRRWYGQLTIKSVEERADVREFTGVATTPSPDLYGDIVDPQGAEFTLPLPLISQHDARAPIGQVISATVTEAGITIKAVVEQLAEPGALKDRLDTAWQEIKLGLVRGLSIGFAPLETARIGETYSYRYTKWRWLELSPVTIPANIDASIQNIRTYAGNRSAVSGQQHRLTRGPLEPPAVAGRLISPQQLQGKPMKIIEQIRAFEARRLASSERMALLMERSAAESRTLDPAETEEYDGLAAEVRSVDEHLVRLRALEQTNVVQARTIEDSRPAAGSVLVTSAGRNGTTVQTVHVQKPLEKGIEFARFVLCLARSRGNVPQALDIAREHYPTMTRIHTVLKAAVAAGTTTDPAWAGALVDYQAFAGDFVEFLRPQTIIGKFGINGIPALRAAPFNTHIKGQNAGGTGYWVGQGKAKPVTKFGFTDTYLGWCKVAAITVLTDDLVRFSNPSAEALCRDGLRDCLVERIDIDFVDPLKAAVADVSPASIVNGVTPIASSGTDAAAIRTDVLAVMSSFVDAGISLSQGVWLMPTSIALSLSLISNPLGQPEFPGVGVNGGTFQGLPVIVSDYIPPDTVILVAANEVWLADDGMVTIDASREAAIEMDTAPAGSSGTPTGAALVSMFQTNSIAIRGERYINWKKRRAGAAAWIAGVAWIPPPPIALSARAGAKTPPPKAA
jgi:HK97 family phage major capsid protein